MTCRKHPILILLVFFLPTFCPELFAREPVRIDLDGTFLSRFVWRGEMWTDDPVFLKPRHSATSDSGRTISSTSISPTSTATNSNATNSISSSTTPFRSGRSASLLNDSVRKVQNENNYDKYAFTYGVRLSRGFEF